MEQGKLPPHKRSYFTLHQCIYSSIAHENEINNFPGTDFIPSNNDSKLKKDNIITNLNKLFEFCINPIFRKFRTDIYLASVYRSKKLNELLGGVENSQHIYGYAADIVSPTYSTATIFNWCKRALSYHQLIWEYPEKGKYVDDEGEWSWIHISYIEGKNFRENSVSSKNPKILEYYKGEKAYAIGDYVHRIGDANEQILI